LIATLSDAYVGHFQLAATRFSDPARAFEIIEKARGRSLTDTLRGDSESISVADEITVNAQQDINRIQLAILHETDQNTRQSLFDQLFATEQLLMRDRKAGPLFGAATERWKPVPLAVVERSLLPDETLLEYVLSEPHSYCLQIRRNGAAVTVLQAGRKHIGDLVEDYLVNVRARRSDIPSGEELFSLLLQPVIADGFSNKIIVIPDGKLNLLPFDALKDQNGRYIVESHVLTYSPSASVLQLLRKSESRKPAEKSLLAVGDVVYSGQAIMTPQGILSHESRADNGSDFSNLKASTLPNLPGTREEITAVAEIVGGPDQVLLANNATESAFKAQQLAEYRIIHLAVHGIVDSAFPDRGALILGSSSSSQEDGLLQAREIMDLPINADLVTLTACDTGRGKLLGQEGIASIETAFLSAGAKSVIASLWTADDVYTINLIKRFYRYIVSGQEKGAALQQAKVDLIKEFGDRALPVYWAGFTLNGDGSTAIFK
jgi:CHAT domain-containing protein